MHNCERQLRSSVLDLLELAPSLQQRMRLVIVDDGSKDETYEAACELARMYPQLTVLRQRVQQGLGAAMQLVRDRLDIDTFVVHDGVSRIEAAELQMLLHEGETEARTSKPSTTTASSFDSSGSRRFAAVRALHDQMEQVHRAATSFRWMQMNKTLVPRRRTISQPKVPITTTQTVGAYVPVADLPAGMYPVG